MGITITQIYAVVSRILADRSQLLTMAASLASRRGRAVSTTLPLAPLAHEATIIIRLTYVIQIQAMYASAKKDQEDKSSGVTGLDIIANLLWPGIKFSPGKNGIIDIRSPSRLAPHPGLAWVLSLRLRQSSSASLLRPAVSCKRHYARMILLQRRPTQGLPSRTE